MCLSRWWQVVLMFLATRQNSPKPYTAQAQVFALTSSTMFLHLVLVLTITTPSNAGKRHTLTQSYVHTLTHSHTHTHTNKQTNKQDNVAGTCMCATSSYFSFFFHCCGMFWVIWKPGGGVTSIATPCTAPLLQSNQTECILSQSENAYALQKSCLAAFPPFPDRKLTGLYCQI